MKIELVFKIMALVYKFHICNIKVIFTVYLEECQTPAVIVM